MAHEFICRLEPLPHPYPTEAATPFEAWGRLFIAVSTSTDVHVLVDTQWNLDTLAEWFIEQHHHLCVEPVAIHTTKQEPTESLAQALLRIYDLANETDDLEGDEQLHEALFAFREAHSLGFALRGANVPWIILGKHHGGAEISSEDTGWCYRFPHVDLCRMLHQELHTFLRAWRVRATDPRTRARADDLLRRLEEVPRTVSTD